MTKYAVTEGDYNDVFAKYELEFKDWLDAELYAKRQLRVYGYKPKQIEDLGTTGICFGVYYPVSDDNGNEVSTDDPRYEELSDQQELRLKYYIEIEEIED